MAGGIWEVGEVIGKGGGWDADCMEWGMLVVVVRWGWDGMAYIDRFCWLCAVRWDVYVREG